MEDIKIKLSTLWAARLLAGLMGDVLRFLQPGMLEEIIANDSDVEITNEMLLFMGIVMLIPIFMSYFSLSLKNKLNRHTNLIFGVFFVIWDFSFLIMVIAWQDPAYEIVYGFAYLILSSLVAWNAWKWVVIEN